MTSTTIVGITGAGGFIGSHLVERLNRFKDYSIVEIHKADFDSVETLSHAVSTCQAVVHCAGINRPDQGDVFATNVSLARRLSEALVRCPTVRHCIFASSSQIDGESDYGKAKKQAADLLAQWADETGSIFSNLIIPNVFGDRGKPFYNSVFATFCYQLTHEEKPTMLKDRELDLIHVNELVEIIRQEIAEHPPGVRRKKIAPTFRCSVSSLLGTLTGYKESYNEKRIIPALSGRAEQQMFADYLSYFSYESLTYSPPVRSDDRGSLIELIKLENGGQVFFSTTKPGFIRGNHYHTRKIERFCVIQGQATIKMRRIGSAGIVTYTIGENEKKFVEIPVFHTHSIQNTGTQDLITIFWANELFNPDDGDTFFEEVEAHG